MSETTNTCGLTIEAAIEQAADIVRSIQTRAVTPEQAAGLIRLTAGIAEAVVSAVKVGFLAKLLIGGAVDALDSLADAIESGALPFGDPA